MKTETKLSYRVYVSKKNGQIYPLTDDESAIDLENPLPGLDMPKYKRTGENNHFEVYELKAKYK